MITIYLKNMAGDITPLSVDPSWQDADLLAHLRSEQKDRGVITLLRSPGPLEDGEIISVWVEEGIYVTQMRVKGKMRTRFVIPIQRSDGDIDELYISRIMMLPRSTTSWYIDVHKGGYQEGVSGTFGGIDDALYRALYRAGYPLSPSTMRTLYSLIDEHLPMTEEIDGKLHIHHYTYSSEEPMECSCGEVVLRREFEGHQDTHVEN